MRSRYDITRSVSILLALLLLAAGLCITPRVAAEDRPLTIEKVTHYAGNTDVYTGKPGVCIRVKRKSTGEVWKGTTDSLGRVVINTGTVVGKDDLEAWETDDCPDPEPQSADMATIPGVVTVALETKQGQVKLTLPADVRAGDTVSGTVYAYDARGNVVRQDREARGSDTLEGAVFEVAGRQHRLRDRVLTFAVPAGLGASALPILLRDGAGRKLAQGQIQLSRSTNATAPSRPGATTPIGPPRPDNFPPTPLGNFQPPRVGQTGRELSIPGSFDGHAETTRVAIGNRPAEFLAESPRSTFARVPADAPAGPTTLAVEETRNVPGAAGPQTVREEFKFNTVAVELAADKLHLMRGEGTTLRITLRGLSEYEELLALELENLSPQVVHFTSQGTVPKSRRQSPAPSGARREVRRMSVNPAEARGGVITLNERLTGISVGAFTIRATLFQDEPKKDFEVDAFHYIKLPGGQARTLSRPVRVNRVGVKPAPDKVDLAVASALPNGMTVVFKPDSGAPSYVSQMDITIAANTPTGKYPLRIEGTGGGLVRHASSIVQVYDPNGFYLSASTKVIKVEPGKSGKIQLRVNRLGNFNQAVNLSHSGDYPSGVGISIDPGTVPGQGEATATVEILVDKNTPDGYYQVVFQGTSQNFGDTETVWLDVKEKE